MNLLSPAEAALLYQHPYLVAWRAMLEHVAAGQHGRIVAVFVDRLDPRAARPDGHRAARRAGFHRTQADRWAFARHYTGESQRRGALPDWLHEYNHHRLQNDIGRRPPPISRLTDVFGQYI